MGHKFSQIWYLILFLTVNIPITHFMPLLGIDIEKPKMNMSVYIIFRLFEIDNIFLPTLFQRGCYPLE